MRCSAAGVGLILSLLLLFTAGGRSVQIETVETAVRAWLTDNIEKKLHRDEVQSRLAQQKDRLETRNGQAELSEIIVNLESFLAEREEDVLKVKDQVENNLLEFAGGSLREWCKTWPGVDHGGNPGNRNAVSGVTPYFNEDVSRTIFGFNESTYQYNIQQSTADYEVQRDICVTYYDMVPVWDAAYQRGIPSITVQYIGTEQGIMRYYPAVETGQGVYDPRVRPWYWEATIGSVSVVFVVDTSESMKEGRHLNQTVDALDQLFTIIPTDVYAGIVLYNTTAYVWPENRILRRVTSDAKKEMKAFVLTASAGGETNTEAGLDAARDMIQRTEAEGTGSKCGEAQVVVFSDGMPTQGNSEAFIDVFNPISSSVRVITYSLGQQADWARMWGSACDTSGIWNDIRPTADFYMTLREFLHYRALGWDGRVKFTQPYIDFNPANGLMLTAATPILDRSVSPPKLFGVAAVDIRLSRFLQDYSTSSVETITSYSFVVNRFGDTLLHPRMGNEYSSRSSFFPDILDLEYWANDAEKEDVLRLRTRLMDMNSGSISYNASTIVPIGDPGDNAAQVDTVWSEFVFGSVRGLFSVCIRISDYNKEAVRFFNASTTFNQTILYSNVESYPIQFRFARGYDGLQLNLRYLRANHYQASGRWVIGVPAISRRDRSTLILNFNDNEEVYRIHQFINGVDNVTNEWFFDPVMPTVKAMTNATSIFEDAYANDTNIINYMLVFYDGLFLDYPGDPVNDIQYDPRKVFSFIGIELANTQFYISSPFVVVSNRDGADDNAVNITTRTDMQTSIQMMYRWEPLRDNLTDVVDQYCASSFDAEAVCFLMTLQGNILIHRHLRATGYILDETRYFGLVYPALYHALDEKGYVSKTEYRDFPGNRDCTGSFISNLPENITVVAQKEECARGTFVLRRVQNTNLLVVAVENYVVSSIQCEVVSSVCTSFESYEKDSDLVDDSRMGNMQCADTTWADGSSLDDFRLAHSTSHGRCHPFPSEVILLVVTFLAPFLVFLGGLWAVLPWSRLSKMMMNTAAANRGVFRTKTPRADGVALDIELADMDLMLEADEAALVEADNVVKDILMDILDRAVDQVLSNCDPNESDSDPGLAHLTMDDELEVEVATGFRRESGRRLGGGKSGGKVKYEAVTPSPEKNEEHIHEAGLAKNMDDEEVMRNRFKHRISNRRGSLIPGAPGNQIGNTKPVASVRKNTADMEALNGDEQRAFSKVMMGGVASSTKKRGASSSATKRQRSLDAPANGRHDSGVARKLREGVGHVASMLAPRRDRSQTEQTENSDYVSLSHDAGIDGQNERALTHIQALPKRINATSFGSLEHGEGDDPVVLCDSDDVDGSASPAVRDRAHIPSANVAMARQGTLRTVNAALEQTFSDELRVEINCGGRVHYAAVASEMELLQLASMYIYDAYYGRSMSRHKNTWLHKKLFALHTKNIEAIPAVIAILHVALVFVEPVSYYRNDYGFHPWTHYEMPISALKAIEALFCMIYIAFYVVHLMYHGLAYARSVGERLYMLVVATISLDVFLWICIGWNIRFSRFIRPALIVLQIHRLRVESEIIAVSITKAGDVLLLMSFVILLYGLFSVFLLKGFYEDRKGLDVYANFENISSALLTLYVLISGENYPDVAVPALNVSYVYWFFFVSFWILSTCMLVANIIAVVFNSYVSIDASVSRHGQIVRVASLACAYRLIVPDPEGGMDELSFVKLIELGMPKRGIAENVFGMQRADSRRWVSWAHGVYRILNKDNDDSLDINEFLLTFGTMNIHKEKDSAFVLPWTWPPIPYLSAAVQSDWFRAISVYIILLGGVTAMWSADGGVRILSYASLGFVQAMEVVVYALFVAEIGIRFVAIGPDQFLKQPWNIYDLFLLFGNTGLFILENTQPPEGFRVLLLWFGTFRVLRLLRLISSVPRFQVFIIIVRKILGTVMSVAVIVMLLTYAYAVIGMELYSQSLNLRTNEKLSETRDPDADVCNFSTFVNASMCLFQILTGNKYNNIVYSALFVDNRVVAGMFFVSYHMLCAIVLLNLVIGYFLRQFTSLAGTIRHEQKLKASKAEKPTLTKKESKKDGLDLIQKMEKEKEEQITQRQTKTNLETEFPNLTRELVLTVVSSISVNPVEDAHGNVHAGFNNTGTSTGSSGNPSADTPST